MKYPLFFAACTFFSSPAVAQAEFEIFCDFSRSISDEMGTKTTQGGRIVSTPALTNRVTEVGLAELVEVKSTSGTRVFVTPNMPHPLISQTITVLSDGRSVRTQNVFSGQGKVGVYSSIGLCEVKE
ncbi:hypothetical protein [Leisingera aquaemixtae]|uniref:hypothetical protein n=1 Tax=Leisingera aquaemixtae TaxID=1396826 RepID=UPI0021A92D17|nr:hypothetical protein [Leisingera aquaemixtae]UWQ47498.1 hypothetical protein K3719_09080 [Leisingera aquaemixtae]